LEIVVSGRTDKGLVRLRDRYEDVKRKSYKKTKRCIAIIEGKEPAPQKPDKKV